MPDDINHLNALSRKNLNMEANLAKEGKIADPLPDLPNKFYIVAKVINDGSNIRMYMSERFLNQSVALDPTHGNSMYVVAGMGYPVVKGYHEDSDKKKYGAAVTLPVEIMRVSVKRDGIARHTCTRHARKILIGDLLIKLTAAYDKDGSAKPIPTFISSSLPTIKMPVVPAAPSPEPVAEQAPPSTQSDHEMLRIAQSLINDAIRNGGYKVLIQDDDTIKLIMEI